MRFIRYTGYLFLLLSMFLFMVACDEPGDNGTINDNHIVLDGEDNMRDMGGFVGANGQTVVYGKLFRSGELSGLTSADLDVLAVLDLDHVIDLRTDKERTKAPDNLPDGPVIHHLPLLSSTIGNLDIKGNDPDQIIVGYMTSLYSTIDSLKIQSWTAIFDLLETGETTLWHCTEGKDRAGMTAALVLLSLGVDKADVVEDFMMSNEYLSQSIESKIGLVNRIIGEDAGEFLRPMLGVDQGYITAFFDTIDDDYGGIDAFLALLDVDIKAMRENYLEAPVSPPACSKRGHGFRPPPPCH